MRLNLPQWARILYTINTHLIIDMKCNIGLANHRNCKIDDSICPSFSDWFNHIYSWFILCFLYMFFVCSIFFGRPFTTAEGAFKKLKPEPNSGLSSVSGGVSSPGSGISSLPQHAGHTPTTASCPTPARRRHRTTFTQVCDGPEDASVYICVCDGW